MCEAPGDRTHAEPVTRFGQRPHPGPVTAPTTTRLVKADRGQKITVTVTAHRYAWTNGSATTKPVTVL